MKSTDAVAVLSAIFRASDYLTQCQAIVTACIKEGRQPYHEEWKKLKALDDMEAARVNALLQE